MPTAVEDDRARSPATLNELMLVVGVVLMLAWGLSIADPCLVGLLMGDPAGNPIAITECRPGITNGDVVVRLAVLMLLACLFAGVFQLIEPERKKLNVAAHVVLALTIGLGIQFVLTMFSPWTLTSPVTVWLTVWITTAIAAFLAALIGSAIARTANQP